MADINLGAELKISAVGAQTAWDAFIAGGQAAGKATNTSLGGTVRKDVVAKIIVDDKGLNKVVFLEKERLSIVDKLNAALQKANDLERGSLTSLRQQVNQAKQLRDGMAKYASSADGVFNKVGKINGAWDTQNQRVRDLQKQLDIAGASNVWQKLAAEYNLKGLAGAGRQISELVNVFQSVSIIVGQVIGSVNQLFDALQKLQSIKLTFEGIGKGGDVGKVFSESSRIALGLGVSLNTVRDGFQQLSPVILATGGNINDVSAITESLSSRFVTFGLSADKSRRVMNGVVQAFSKGKLMAEELTQQISEADPAFRTDLAQAIGVTVQELGEMVKAGEVTNALLLDAIPRMTKSAGLFGKLGDSALDAAQGFREGGVTVEQFRNQIATIEQLSLENLVNPETGSLQPLLASLLELRAVVTDVGVAFASSEVFKTFLVLLGSIASQVSFVIQVLVKLGSAVASITQPIFAVINAVDSLGGLLEGFGIISSLVAGVIVTKLVAALVTLGSGAIVGAASAAITGLTTALNFLAGGGLAKLVGTIGTAIISFTGLGAAATTTAGAEAAATAATTARSAAVGFLTEQLGLQAAAEALATKAKGTSAATQLAIPGLEVAGAAAEALGPTNSLKEAVGGLIATFIKFAPVILPVVAAIGTLAAGIAIYKAVNEDASDVTTKFSASLKTIQANAKLTKEAFDNGAKGASEFAVKLEALEKANRFEVGAKSGFQQQLTEVNIDRVIDSTKKVGEQVKSSLAIAQKAVEGYDAANDKSGIKAKKIAEDIKVAQAAVTSALEITRAKRDQLLQEEIKAGKPSAGTIERLKALDAEIQKLEEVERKEAAVRAEARKKGIVVDVELNVKDAAALTGDLQEKLKGLKASVVLETNPEKRAQLQGDLNALTAQLQFLEGDKTEIKIEAKYKIDTRALKDAADLGSAFLDNLKAAGDQAQSVLSLQAAGFIAQEAAGQSQLDNIKERLDKEKEIREEKITAAEEAGASEAEIKALKKADLAAEKTGREEVKAKENEIKAIAEKKRQVEVEAIKAKIAALPAQQAAEQAGLKIQQEMARLELERLLNASKRAKLEGQGLLTRIGGDISQAVKDKDPAEEQRLRDLYNGQLEYLKLLDAEQVSLTESISKRNTIDGLQRSTLALQQQATSNQLQAELSAQNIVGSQTATTQAVQAQATAAANLRTNAAGYAQAAQTGSEYEKSGALAARLKADAAADAAAANKDSAGATEDATDATQDAAGATQDAVGSTGDITANLQDGANAAEGIANSLNGLPNEIAVRVKYVGGPSGLWTGGPTTGGQTYRINELGKEGFLSSSGDLSAINKPRNALWKAPGKGMVIPAHIMSTLDVPTGRVSTGVRPAVAGSGGNGLAKIARAIQAALSQTNNSDSGLQEMAAVQAHQAIQIGKLSRAVTKLADKDWNVNVGVRNTGGTAYLDALNRRM